MTNLSNTKITDQEMLPLPDKLYKYRTIDKALKILNEQTLYFSSPLKFNDPFDCKIVKDYQSVADSEELQRLLAKKIATSKEVSNDKIDERFEKIISSGKLKDKNILMQIEEGHLNLMQEFGVFCLSNVSDNLLMWSHYAHSHEGICIGFNSKMLIKASNPIYVAPVKYNFIYPRIPAHVDDKVMMEIVLFAKSIDWDYEEEYRYITNSQVEIKIPTEVVEEIYLGCMITEENELLIKQIKAEKFPHARLIKFKKSKMNFALEKEEI
jgi:DUF2971 family protein